MDDLIKFLRARLDEDEHFAIEAAHPRQVADVDAKRRMLAAWPDPFGQWNAVQADAARAMKEQMLKLLALPFAYHPDYRQEWRP